MSNTPGYALENSSSDEPVFRVQSPRSELPVVTVDVDGTSLQFFVDSGAGNNTVEETWRNQLQTGLERTTTRHVP